MNAKNHAKLMEEQIKELSERRADVLLHCCCAPCASSCMEQLKDSFNITAYFFNPNICGNEYQKREAELKRFIAETGWATLLPCAHDESLFYEASRGLENEKEGGARCERCFYLRLKRTAETAKAEGFEFFTTTLTLSPLKNAALINQIGEQISDETGVKWLHCDFKKNNGYLRSLQLSKEHGLYRQNFCGCIYSQNTKNC